MKTLLIGYKDANGTGPFKVMEGSELVPAEQYKLFHKCKNENSFPEGIIRVEWVTVEIKAIAIEIPKEKTSKKTK